MSNRGHSSVVEQQPSKLLVEGSNPSARSITIFDDNASDSVIHFPVFRHGMSILDAKGRKVARLESTTGYAETECLNGDLIVLAMNLGAPLVRADKDICVHSFGPFKVDFGEGSTETCKFCGMTEDDFRRTKGEKK